MKDKYTFPALFCYKETGEDIGVVFPDLPGCTSHSDGETDAWKCAKEALSLHLWGMEEDGDEIPEPTPIPHLSYADYEEPGWKIAAALIEVWMPAFREKMSTKSTTRAVTLPGWLDKIAKAANLNYSQILQDGIMERLGVSRAATQEKNNGFPNIKLL